MVIESQHFNECSKRHVHLDLHWDKCKYRVEDVLPKARQIAAEKEYHFVHIDGRNILDEDSMCDFLAEAYEFPVRTKDNIYKVRGNFEDVAFWMGRLSWLYNLEDITHKYKGFMLVYTDPEYFCVRDPIRFQDNIDCIVSETSNYSMHNIPFHFIFTPINYFISGFLARMQISEYVCFDCGQEAGDKYKYLWE